MARYVSKYVALVVLVCFMAGALGCTALSQTAHEHPTAAGAAAGGVIGGAVGATAGGLIGGNAKSALIGGVAGAVVGAVAGGLFGHYKAQQVAGAQDTAKAEAAHVKAKEAPSKETPKTESGVVSAAATPTPDAPVAEPPKPQGTYVRLKAIEVEPSEVGPGDTVKINFVYALLTPNPKAKTAVQESRSVTFNGEEIGTVTFTKEHTSGTWKTTVPLAIPSAAEPGSYIIKGQVKAGEVETAETKTFTVQKKM